MQLQSAPNCSPMLKNSLSPSKCLQSLSLSQRDIGIRRRSPVPLYFFSLLEEKLCHTISCTNQTILLCCMWERNSLPNHVHLWGVTLEQHTVIDSLFLSNLWRLCEISTGDCWGLQTPRQVTSPGTLQVLPFYKWGSKDSSHAGCLQKKRVLD